jgi:hypothetical protein
VLAELERYEVVVVVVVGRSEYGSRRSPSLPPLAPLVRPQAEAASEAGADRGARCPLNALPFDTARLPPPIDHLPSLIQIVSRRPR